MVTCDSHLRRITHYHYTSWPDFGTPATESFLELEKAVGPTVDGKPIVVHCSAGLGRSGVFITVHTALECFKNKRKVDIKEIASKLRKQREGMIQSQDQYRFCLEAVADKLAPERDVGPIELASPLPPAPPIQAERPADDVRVSRPSSGMTTPPPAERGSPPPPSSSPPPPISQPETPRKVQLPTSSPLTPSSPEITFTGPTPRSSREETDRELIQRKLDTMVDERDKDKEKPSKEENNKPDQGKERKRGKESLPDRYSVASITQRTPAVKPETSKKSTKETEGTEVVEGTMEEETEEEPPKDVPKEEPKSQSPKLPKNDKESRPQKTENDKQKATKEGERTPLKEKDKLEAQKPPPKKEVKEMKVKTEATIETVKPQQKKERVDKGGRPDAPKKDEPGESEAKGEASEKEEEEEVEGFSIGEDPLDFKPPPKKSLKDQKQPKPSSQQQPWRYQKKPTQFTPPKAPPPSSKSAPAPPEKLTKRPPTPKQRHRQNVVKNEPEVYTRAIKKLVIPSAFGSGGQSPIPSPRVSPKPLPRRLGHTTADTTKHANEPHTSPARKPPSFGISVLPLSPRPPVEPRERGNGDLTSGEKPRNVLDMIKNIEHTKTPASKPATPAYKLPVPPQKATLTSVSPSPPSSPSKPAYKLPTPAKRPSTKPLKEESESTEETRHHHRDVQQGPTSYSSSSSLKKEETSGAGNVVGGGNSERGNVASLMKMFQGGVQ